MVLNMVYKTSETRQCTGHYNDREYTVVRRTEKLFSLSLETCSRIGDDIRLKKTIIYIVVNVISCHTSLLLLLFYIKSKKTKNTTKKKKQPIFPTIFNI